MTSTADSGAGTLRAALSAVCSGGTITFASSLVAAGPAQIVLASPLAITQNLTINGPGANDLAVSGNGAVTVFQINAGVTAQLAGLTIANGWSSTNGAGVSNAGTLTLSNVAVAGNASAVSGGGIYNTGTLTILGSALYGNHAPAGGALSSPAGSVVIGNSTFFGNTAANGSGGAINNAATLQAVNATIAGNAASQAGGGVYSSGGQVKLTNTIVANNTAAVQPNDIAVQSGVLIPSIVLTGTLALEPLQDNGGPTWTMALPPGSAAIDVGNGAACTAAPVNGVDQRGVLRPQGVQCDVGAYEATATGCPPHYPVLNLNDSGSGSLRQALIDACPGSTIFFDAALTANGPSTITLSSTLAITQNLTIAGPGGGQVTVSGNNSQRVFSVGSGVAATLYGLTIVNGQTSDIGGGIYNSGTLTVAASILSNNLATTAGGAVANNGILNLLASTLNANESAAQGGGIYNTGVLTVVNSTLYANDATADGGGIYNVSASGSAGSLVVINATLSDNDSGSMGGGIYSMNGSAVLENSIIANNSASQSLPNQPSNDIGSFGATINIAQVVSGSVTLGPLAYNAGATPTMALPAGSSAIGVGDNALCAAPPVNGVDQRGTARPQGLNCDLGAYETGCDPGVNAIEVQNNGSSGPGSLADAISSICRNGTITFAPSLTANGPVTITAGGIGTSYLGTNMTIIGPGPDLVQIYCVWNNTPMWVVDATAAVKLENMNFSGFCPSNLGYNQVAIVNNGWLTLTNSTVTGFNNSALQNNGVLVAQQSTLSGNGQGNPVQSITQANQGGGLWNASGATATLDTMTVTNNYASNAGGNIWSAGTLKLTNSTVANGSSYNAGGIYTSGSAQISGATITGNSAQNTGGGVYLYSGSADIENSTLSNNQGSNDTSYAWVNEGGGIYIYAGDMTLSSSSLQNNSALVGGGAIFNQGGSLTVNGGTFSNNAVGGSGGCLTFGNSYGGAIANYSTLQVNNATLSTNNANNCDKSGYESYGGGIYNDATMTLDNSTFDDNSANNGGGVYNAGTATISNATWDNTSKSGGSIDNVGTENTRVRAAGGAQQGATVHTGAMLTLTHATIVGAPNNDPAAVVVHNGAQAVLNLYNSIIAHGACLNAGGTLATNISNLIEDGSCAENAVGLRTGDAKLAPAADNGGPTRTVALQPSSPAIDGADPRYCTNSDQRGVARPQGPACDIGAYEFAGLKFYLPIIGRR